MKLFKKNENKKTTKLPMTGKVKKGLGELCSSFETMRFTLANNFSEMWRQMEERKQLNAAFAHDLRTPLTVLKGYNEILQSNHDPITKSTAATMRKHIFRLERYVDSMSHLRRLEDAQPISDKDRSHLLTGILKCPICGSSMYTNKHAWTNKDGTYKEVYYYICGRNKQERGHHCDYKASLRKTDIEPLVIEAVKELVSDKYFAKEIEKRIGVQTDTTAIDKELANYESKLKEVDLNKARLEREIDNLPIDARFRERKIHDMTLRLDGLYDTIVELEERIEDAKLRRSSIEMEAITLDNIYKLMLNFGKLYDIISDEEKKNLITYLIKEIQIYPNGESEMPLKSIEFNFPIYRDGQEVRRLLWEKGNTVDRLLYQEKRAKKLRRMAE